MTTQKQLMFCVTGPFSSVMSLKRIGKSFYTTVASDVCRDVERSVKGFSFVQSPDITLNQVFKHLYENGSETEEGKENLKRMPLFNDPLYVILATVNMLKTMILPSDEVKKLYKNMSSNVNPELPIHAGSIFDILIRLFVNIEILRKRSRKRNYELIKEMSTKSLRHFKNSRHVICIVPDEAYHGSGISGVDAQNIRKYYSYCSGDGRYLKKELLQKIIETEKYYFRVFKNIFNFTAINSTHELCVRTLVNIFDNMFKKNDVSLQMVKLIYVSGAEDNPDSNPIYYESIGNVKKNIKMKNSVIHMKHSQKHGIIALNKEYRSNNVDNVLIMSNRDIIPYIKCHDLLFRYIRSAVRQKNSIIVGECILGIIGDCILNCFNYDMIICNQLFIDLIIYGCLARQIYAADIAFSMIIQNVMKIIVNTFCTVLYTNEYDMDEDATQILRCKFHNNDLLKNIYCYTYNLYLLEMLKQLPKCHSVNFDCKIFPKKLRNKVVAVSQSEDDHYFCILLLKCNKDLL